VARTATAHSRRRRERGSISVDQIINAPFEVAADLSIDNLSMPVLARHLDVGITSIHWYFRKKSDPLDAMTDRALDEYNFMVPSIDASNWRESLRDHAITRSPSAVHADSTASDEIRPIFIRTRILEHCYFCRGIRHPMVLVSRYC
jgi:AcrR family transcriptional regulator